MDEPTLSTEELFLVLYCTIDELYQEGAPDCVQSRPGSDRLEMSDAEVITLSVMQEGRSNDSELSFHRMVEKDYSHLFPDLISRSRYHRRRTDRRRKDLMGIQPDGHSTRDFAPTDGPTSGKGCLAHCRLCADHHSGVSPVEVSPDVDVGG